MKNSRTLALITALLLVPLSSSAQLAAEQAECNRITSAADAGRTRAIDRLSSIQQLVKQQVATANVCQERFGDIASRVTVTIGGFDVAPIRDAIFEKACDIISSKTGSILSQATSQLTPLTDLTSKIPGLPTGSIPTVSQITSQIPNYGQLPPTVQQQFQSQIQQQIQQQVGAPQTSQTQGLWDRIASKLTSW
jgi:hypothetical protein